MNNERLDHSGFVSEKTGNGAFSGKSERMVYALRGAAFKRAQHLRSRESHGGSMIIKLSVCALACAAVLAVKTLRQSDGTLSVSTLTTQQDDTAELGRLQFVNLPGIIEVFAPAKGTALPISGEKYELKEDGLLLVIRANGDQQAQVRETCSVKTVDTDAELGDYVSITTAQNDAEIIYYGLDTISVEAGQPLASGDELGTIADGALLSIRLNLEGRPSSPAEYFNIQTSEK